LSRGGTYTQADGAGAAFGTSIWGINASGQLALTYAPSSNQLAHRWTPLGGGSYAVADLSIPGSLGTYAGGMNNNGDMVGYFQTPGYGAFLWRADGSLVTFNHPADGQTTQALGINDSGVIVGAYFASHITGFVLQNGVYTDINYPGQNYTYATGINNDGTIVGWYLDGRNQAHGFIATELPEPATFGLTGMLSLVLLWRRRR